MEAGKIVVLQPGSYQLRFGLASDSAPQTIPNVIARRVSNKSEMKINNGSLAPPPPVMSLKLRSLKSIKTTPGFRNNSSGAAVPPAKVYNEQNSMTALAEGDYQWTNTKDLPPFFVGEEALNISPSDPYELNRPIRRSALNITNPTALRVVCSDLQAIWEYAIVHKLGIPLRDLGNYGVCLVVPDIYDRKHIKEMINILVGEMRFKAIFMHQESVCAAFGAGIATACVVDIGHDKVGVTCVEDGVTLSNTRLSSWYGLDDVGKLLHWLLLKRDGHQPIHTFYFPYNECRMERPRDAAIIHGIKEALCHVPPTDFSVKTHQFAVRAAGRPPAMYNISLGDALAVAPMGIFYPDAFAPLEVPPPPVDTPYHDTENPYDETFLSETATGKPSKLEAEAAIDMLDRRVTLPIDELIAKSIGLVERPDLRGRLYTTILIAGGGGLLQGLGHMLEDRLFDILPGDLERVEVVTARRDPLLDSRNLSWRGGAIAATLENAKDMWILKHEWQYVGVPLLRERLPFAWA